MFQSGVVNAWAVTFLYKWSANVTARLLFQDIKGLICTANNVPETVIPKITSMRAHRQGMNHRMTNGSADKCKKCSLRTKTGSFCCQLADDELDMLGSGSKATTLKRGQSIESEELMTWPVISITSGVIGMQHLLEDGRKTIAAIFMPGDIIDMRGISNRNRGNLIALNKTSVCRLSPKAFEDIVDTNADALRLVWGNLRKQTYRAMEHSADLAKKQALEKLASFIFECRHRQPKGSDDDTVIIPVRRIDLAEYLGMQPETVSRCFRDMMDRNIIEFSSMSNIKIISAPVLRRIANGDKCTDTMRDPTKEKFKVLSFG